jgi:hypothetical protein
MFMMELFIICSRSDHGTPMRLVATVTLMTLLRTCEQPQKYRHDPDNNNSDINRWQVTTERQYCADDLCMTWERAGTLPAEPITTSISILQSKASNSIFLENTDLPLSVHSIKKTRGD